MSQLTPTAHARFSPSAASRWMTCPASLVLPCTKDDVSSAAAQEGTVAHEIAAQLLTAHFELLPAPKFDDVIEGIVVTAEMLEDVQVYVNNIIEAHDAFSLIDSYANVFIEKQVDFAKVLNVPAGQQFGTADAILYAPDTGILEVHDLKFGRGVKVSAQDNPQLLMYALGAIDLMADMFAGFPPIKTVRTAIHQVRISREPDVAEYSIKELNEFRKKVKAAADRVNRLTPETLRLSDFAPSESACRWCSHLAQCPAQKNLLDDFFEKMGAESVYPAAELLTNADMDAIYPQIPVVRMFLDAVEARIADEIAGGATFSNAKLVYGRPGNRAWSDPDAVERILQSSLAIGNEDIYKKTLVSPAQAEKLLKKNPEEFKRLEEYIAQKEPQPTLAPANDKRPAIEPLAFKNTNIDDLI